VTLYARFAAHLDAILDALEVEDRLARGVDRKGVAVEPPRDPSHGDLATNAAMVLAKRAGTNPRALAALIAPKLSELDEVESADLAGPGFINIRLVPSVWTAELRTILDEGAAYGRSRLGQGSRVNVEYVSANPPGRCTWAIAAARSWRCAGEPARTCGLFRYARILCRTMPAGRSIRSPAPRICAYREALGGGDRRHPPMALYPGDYPEARRRALRRRLGTPTRGPETEWRELFSAHSRADAGADPRRSRAFWLGIITTSSRPKPRLQGSGAADRVLAHAPGEGPRLPGPARAPKGEISEDWEPVELTLFRSTGSATTRTGR
jgi:arginyl-tRNA synthetase